LVDNMDEVCALIYMYTMQKNIWCARTTPDYVIIRSVLLEFVLN
jgi:hypothetical protein